MTIREVSVRLQSPNRSCDELTRLVGERPTRSAERGEPVSSRNPNGPLHSASTWVLRSSLEGVIEFAPHVNALKPILERVAEMPNEVQRDLIVLAEAASLGSLVELDHESLQLLAGAHCSVILDLYCQDE
jgi:hypothetical protein